MNNSAKNLDSSNSSNSSNRIEETFKKNKKAFIAFITGGDPDIETTEQLIIAMANSGVDIIEIGIPFSDPIAEGPIIQAADERALSAGCTVDQLFEMTKKLRKKLDIPLLFMTYINPIFAYGVEKFMDQCASCGIDGIIVPDLPYEEKDELAYCTQKGIKLISLIAPTSQERITTIAKEAEGFLYCVSSLGVTGVRSEITTNVAEMISQVKKITDIPCAIGFGISTPSQAAEMAKLSDGVIIGSALVSIIAQHGKNSVGPLVEFVKEIRGVV